MDTLNIDLDNLQILFSRISEYFQMFGIDPKYYRLRYDGETNKISLLVREYWGYDNIVVWREFYRLSQLYQCAMTHQTTVVGHYYEFTKRE